MTFNRTVNLKYSQKSLVQQSIKARAVLESYLRKHKHMPVNVIFDLFDTLIKPILLYACEVWGINMGNDIEQFFLQGRLYLKNRQKPTATLIYTDNIIYNINTTYIPPPPIINTFFDVKIY